MEKTRENNMDLLRLICCIAVIIIHVTVGYYDIAMYIKVKIRNVQKRKVFCISFYFARFENKKFPYQGGESL